MNGRIDVHSHLLPGVDDGCANVTESIECARMLVEAGYSHAFCTPHIWPNLTHNNTRQIPKRVEQLQSDLDRAGVPLKLMSGGELNFRPELPAEPAERIVSYNMLGRYCVFDLWADALPDFFEPCVRFLQSKGLKVIMAHPERMRAVQEHPSLADWFDDLGLLLQGNLQCFSDKPDAATRILVEQWLKEGRYFLLGSDTHNPRTLPPRLAGLKRAIEVAGEAAVDQLTRENPRKLMER